MLCFLACSLIKTTHLLTFFREVRLEAFLETRTFRTLVADLTFRGDLETDRLTFFPVDFLARGIILLTTEKKIIFLLFTSNHPNQNCFK
jgi:hypothetical protein